MSSRREEELTEFHDETTKPRFHIEKLEERIAPAKGGIPGKPTGHNPHGKHYCEPWIGWGGYPYPSC